MLSTKSNQQIQLRHSDKDERGFALRREFLKKWCAPGSRALDAGCGQGSYSLPLATIARHVDAIDIDANALADLAAAGRDLEIQNVRPMHTDLVTGEFASGQYDFCLCMGTLMLLSAARRRAALKRIRNAVTPGGVILIDFYTPRYLFYRLVFQPLPLKLKMLSFLCLIFRRSYLTGRGFERDATAAGLRILAEGSEIDYPESPYPDAASWIALTSNRFLDLTSGLSSFDALANSHSG